MMKENNDFTKGKILAPLLKFAFPVLCALILQAMYGAVDLLVVGKFGTAADISAVSTGTQILHTITGIITGLSVGTTILIGQYIGAGRKNEAGDIIGAAIWLFAALGIVITVVVPVFANPLCTLMNAPEEAFEKTVQYVSICCFGALFIVAYNVLGSVFRGMGDSKTPLLAVIIACIVNIFGDLLFVAVFDMAAAGAAIATVMAQAISVVLCFVVIRRKGLPFPFGKENLALKLPVVLHTVKLGFPIALQDCLVSISFLVILRIVNSLGLIVSAGVGVAEKLCAFIMLVPSAFSQALSAFVAQNIGAGQEKRARKALLCGMLASFCLGIVMSYLSFFHGDMLAMIFTNDTEVAAMGWEYLKAYSIDTLLVSFLFCYIGYFNGCGCTAFVMAQGIIGAFGVRIPVSYFMSKRVPVSVFGIALATPCSTVVQIIVCSAYFIWIHRKNTTTFKLQ